jgi:hypothetical protein
METVQSKTFGETLKERLPLLILLLLFVLVLAAILYAFTAANVVPATVAGEGRGAVTGHTVSNITYDTLGGLDTDPGTLEAVTFDIDVAAGEAYLGLDTDGNGTVDRWWACTGGPTAWSCDVTAADTATATAVVDIEQIQNLEVVTLE